MGKKNEAYYMNVRPEMLAFIPKTANKILEIGCGEGNFSAQLNTGENETWAVEPYEPSAKKAQEKLHKVIVGTLDEKLNELPDNYFDVIIMNDVIEHLLEPWDDIVKLKSKLNTEGVLVTSIPNVRYAKNLFKMIFKRDWKYTDDLILDRTHYRFFTKKSIKRMYQDCGYKIQKMKGINRTKSFFYFPFAVLFNILFLGSQLDMFFMQYATVVKKKA
ncbi:MAG: class I SAM-dependent methyltransferase [Flavobacteriaceae bacterium]